MSHIDFDEIVKHAISDRIDSDYLELAARINRHVLTCPECFKMYKAIDTFLDCTQNISLAHPNDKRNTKIFELIYKSDCESKLLEDFISKLRCRKEYFNISTDELQKISSIINIISTVTLSDDGVLALTFEKNSVKKGDIIYLCDDGSAYFSVVEEDEKNLPTVSFSNIKQGEYSILL